MKKKLTILTVLIAVALFMYAGCDLLTGTYPGDIRIPGTNGRLTLTISRYNFITRSGKYEIEANIGNVLVESGNIKIRGWSEKEVILSNRKHGITGNNMKNYTISLSGDNRMPYYADDSFNLTPLLIP